MNTDQFCAIDPTKQQNGSMYRSCLNVTCCILIASSGWSTIGFAVVAAHFQFVHFGACTFQIVLYLEHGGIQCESVHAVTGGDGAGSMSQVVEGGHSNLFVGDVQQRWFQAWMLFCVDHTHVYKFVCVDRLCVRN